MLPIFRERQDDGKKEDVVILVSHIAGAVAISWLLDP